MSDVKREDLYSILGAPTDEAATVCDDGVVDDYGIVYITKGVHKGKIAYYDDEEYNGLAIVYFGVPFLTPYYCVRHTSMRPATREEVAVWNLAINSENAHRKAVEEMRADMRERDELFKRRESSN